MSTKTNSVQIGQINRVAIDTPAPSGIIVIDLIRIKYLIVSFVKKNWLNLLIFVLFIYLVLIKSQTISISFAQVGTTPTAELVSDKVEGQTKNIKQKKQNYDNEAAFIGGALTNSNNNDPTEGVVEVLPQRPNQPVKSAYAKGGNDANLFDNVSIFVAPERAEAAVVKSKRDKCWDYVRRFVTIAKTEKQKFGIPVSITLAQGLLESDAGESRLTRAANNHFGVKTFNARVPHVVMKDDSPTDKFKKYDTAWESYRDHSLLLMRDHYKSLQYLSKVDYVNWAKGLQKAGYATDPQYAAKLIKIIENLQLYKLDEV
ncbi:MAG: glucosaminidase domain-containing protein [Saprospiraceae bacterium]|nr:glucosaminidase domain-containing protein [Saprospiraceae bacterium]